MRERITAIITWLREKWANATKRMRFLFLGTVAVVLAAVLILLLLYNQKDYVVLYNDLTAPQNAEVIAALSDAGVPYTVDNGRVLVESKNEGRARLTLATMGFQNTGFKYDIANSGGLTATQQDKDRNYIYNLQERLQATITEFFPEINASVVTISVPQKSAFALNTDVTEPSAAIMLQKKTGYSLTPEQVRGIVNLVKDSVQGLTEANITIADERGDLKSTLDLNDDYNNKKLQLTEQVNQQLGSAIKAMVGKPYGTESIEVRVMATLNTDANVSERRTYLPFDPNDPTNSSNNPLDYTEIDRQRTGDGFAAAQGVPGAQDNVQTPQYAAQEAEAMNSAYYSSHDVYDYLVGSLVEQIVKDGFVVERATAAILIDQASLPDGERDAIIALAANASGIAPENITVQNIKFKEPPPIVPPTTANTGRIFIIAGLGLLLFCIIMIVVLTMVSRRRKRLAAEAAAAQDLLYDENGVPLIDLMNQEEDYEPIALVESNEHKLKMQIKDLAESDPEIVAQLIKTWLVSDR